MVCNISEYQQNCFISAKFLPEAIFRVLSNDLSVVLRCVRNCLRIIVVIIVGPSKGKGAHIISP